jgi:hypothetical protein
MAVKYTNFIHSKAFQNVPELKFWYENVPSGNPAFVSLLSTLYKNEFLKKPYTLA